MSKQVVRNTEETSINIVLNLASSVSSEIKTSIPIFDHFLKKMSEFGEFSLKLTAKGDNNHHIVEDVGICLGELFLKLEKKSRIGYSIVSMDDALSLVAIDTGGRGYPVIDTKLTNDTISSEISPDLIRHFLESFALNAKVNLHVKILHGSNYHHIFESIFKALGMSLKEILA